MISSFKDGNITSEKYRQQLIDTFVHAVFVYDDKIVITYNYSGENNTATISDLNFFNPKKKFYHHQEVLAYLKKEGEWNGRAQGLGGLGKQGGDRGRHRRRPVAALAIPEDGEVCKLKKGKRGSWSLRGGGRAHDGANPRRPIFFLLFNSACNCGTMSKTN